MVNNSMSESIKIFEMKEIDDKEKLHSLGYDRLAEFNIYSASDKAYGTLQNASNYGHSIGSPEAEPAVGGGNSNGVFLKFLAKSHLEVQTWLKSLRDDSNPYWDIANDEYFGLNCFAHAWLKGYMHEKLSYTMPTNTNKILMNDVTDGNDANGKAAYTLADIKRNGDDTSTTNGFKNGFYQLAGWTFGLAHDLIPGVSSITANINVSKRKMIKFAIVIDYWKWIATYPMIGFQSVAAKINLGRLFGKVPKEYDFIEANSVNSLWDFIRKGQHTILDINGPTDGVCIDNLTNWVNYNWDDLPTTTLDHIIKKQSRSWEVPSYSLQDARQYFGFGYSEWDFPTNFVNLFTLGDEGYSDSKKVGYDLSTWIWFMDEFYKNDDSIPTIFKDVLANEHWTYKGFKDAYKDLLQTVGPGSFKGYCDNDIFVSLKWFYRTVDETKNNGYYSYDYLWQDQTDTNANEDILARIAVTAPDDDRVLYVRGGWNVGQIRAFLWFDLMFGRGTDGSTLYNSVDLNRQVNFMGQHYQTRHNRNLNYVSANDGYTNNRFGSNPIFDGDLRDQLGLQIVDITAQFVGFTRATINTRLPTSKYPKPIIVENIYDMDKITPLASLIIGHMPAPASTTGGSNTNKNDSESTSSNADEEADVV